jgi:2-C-methyl-D-erythritol 4-phosphate cytidylyltransferase
LHANYLIVISFFKTIFEVWWRWANHTFFMKKKYTIIVAGGSGNRMKADIPKQFLMLGNQPILVHTITTFMKIPDNHIVVALPKDAMGYWEEIRNTYFASNLPLTVVEGGKTRFQSVKNALDSIEDSQGLVAVHDAVRPFVTEEIINATFDLAEKKQAVVVCVSAKDSVRILGEDGNRALEREKIKLVQTPQTFDLQLLKTCYNLPEESFFTDDASVVERAGYPVFLVEGDYHNIKITTPEDLAVGELFLCKRK